MADAVASVEGWLAGEKGESKEEAGFRKLARWMLSGAVSPWEYMPAQDADFLENPFEAARVLAKIHHALCDDGEVSFVRLSAGGEALRWLMVFADPSDPGFASSCKKECAELIQAQIRGRESLARVWEASAAGSAAGAPLRLGEEDFVFEAVSCGPAEFLREVERFADQKKTVHAALACRLGKSKPG